MSTRIPIFQPVELDNPDDLRTYFQKALSPELSSDKRLFIETAPTGLGKTHQLTETLIERCKQALSNSDITPSLVFIVAPMHRHIEPIFRSLKLFLEKLDTGDQRNISLDRAYSVVDMLKKYKDFMPRQCPLLRGKSDEDLAAQGTLKELGRLAQAETIRGMEENLSRGRYDLRKEYCAKVVEKNETICQDCRLMHFGQATIAQAEERKLTLIFCTYDKLYSGFDAFEISPAKGYRLIHYSPWVLSPQGVERPITDARFILEESSAGFMRLWNKINEDKLRINLNEYVQYVHNHFEPAIKNTLAEIKTVYRDDPSIPVWINERLSEMAEVSKAFKKLYVLVGENKFHALAEGSSVTFRGDLQDAAELIQSHDLFYSSLFSKRVMGYKGSFHDDLNSIAVDVRTFENIRECRDEDWQLLHPLAYYWRYYGVLPHVHFFREFHSACFEKFTSTDYFSMAVNKLYTDDNELSRNKRDYFYALFTHAEKQRSLQKALKVEDPGYESDSQDRFYLGGYECYSMPHQEEKDERFIQITARLRTPEGMIFALMHSGSNNMMCMVSASAALDSPLSTFNLKWLNKVGIENKMRPKGSLNFHIHQKHHPTKRAKPKVLVARPDLKRHADGTLSYPGKSEIIRRFLSDSLRQHPNWIKKTEDKAEDPLYALVEFLETIVIQAHDPRPRYALYLANSANDADTAIKIVNYFFEWARSNRIELGIRPGRTQRISAEDFKEDEGLNQAAQEQQTTINDITQGFITHLLSDNPPELYFLSSTYNSVATGANFQLRIDLDVVSGLLAESRGRNVLAYIGETPEIRYYAPKTSKKATVDIDLSDIILSVAKTYVVNEENHISIAHILAATNQLEFPLLGRGIIHSDGRLGWTFTSSRVKSTLDYAAVQFDNMLQTSGRMDRSFMLPAHATVILSHDLKNIICSLGTERLSDTILTHTFEHVLSNIRKDDHIVPPIRHDGDKAQKWIESLFQDACRQKPGAQVLWHKLRGYLANYQVINKTTLQHALSGKKTDRRPENDLMDVLEHYAQYKNKGTQHFLRNFFDEVPSSMIYHVKPITEGLRRPVIRMQMFINAREIGETREYLYGTGVAGVRQNIVTRDLSVAEEGATLLVLQPRLIKQLSIPARDELATREKLQHFHPATDMPPELFEVADSYIPDLNLCIDNKSFSRYAMEEKLTDETRLDLLAKGRDRLSIIERTLQRRHRLVYIFRNWWNTLDSRPIQCYEPNSRLALSPRQAQDFDVAFIRMDRVDEWPLLFRLIRFLLAKDETA